MTTETLERTQEAAQAASALSCPQSRALPLGADLVAALAAAVASEDTLAQSVEDHLSGALSQARLRKDHARASEASRSLEWFRDLRGAALLANPAAARARAADPDLPAPSAAIVLWRMLVEALLPLLGYDDGKALLTSMSRLACIEEDLAEVVPIHRHAEWREVNHARRQAVEIFRRYLHVLVARLPERSRKKRGG